MAEINSNHSNQSAEQTGSILSSTTTTSSSAWPTANTTTAPAMRAMDIQKGEKDLISKKQR